MTVSWHAKVILLERTPITILFLSTENAFEDLGKCWILVREVAAGYLICRA